MKVGDKITPEGDVRVVLSALHGRLMEAKGRAQQAEVDYTSAVSALKQQMFPDDVRVEWEGDAFVVKEMPDE